MYSINLLATYAVTAAIAAIRSQVAIPPVAIQGDIEDVQASQAQHDAAVGASNTNILEALGGLSASQRAEHFVAAFRADPLLQSGVSVFNRALVEQEAALYGAMESIWLNERRKLA